MAKGSVRKKGKKWYYRFYVEDASGKMVQKEYAGTESKSETEKLLRKALEDYEDKKFVAKADNLTVVHGIDTGFLAFRRCIRFIDHCPVARRSGAQLIVGKAVHILCPLCGFFIDQIIFRHSTSFHKSRNFGTNCPKAPAAKMLTASHGNRAGHRNIHLPQKRALKSLVISGFRLA